MADVAMRRLPEFEAADWFVPPHAYARWILRGDPEVRRLVGAAFHLPLPNVACRAAATGDRAALWLGPDEHLMIARETEHGPLQALLEAAVGERPHSLVDVSHRQLGFGVRGPRAEWLLEAQCPLPLNLRDFPADTCTRTVYGKAEIVLWRIAADEFHVEVWRSFARYVHDLLCDVASEREG